MLLWGHPLMKLFVLIVSPSVSFLFEITISARPARHDIQSPLSVTFYPKRRAITLLHLPTTSQVLLLGSSFRINLENVMLPPNRHLPRLRLD
jgi:hypothetical protein